MAKLTDPFEIIRRQGASKEEFDLDQIIDLYDSCVAQFDSEVGRLLEHVEQSGLAENTIIVLYSDHGTEFFERNSWGQGNSVIGDSSSRIPLVIKVPGCAGGGVVSASVRSIDITPTLLDFLDISPPAQMEGASLAGVIRGTKIATDRNAFTETGFWLTDIPGLPIDHMKYPNLLDVLEICDRETSTLSIMDAVLPQLLKAKDRALRQGDWELVYQPLNAGYQLLLFNVREDPECARNLLEDYPERARQMWNQLRDWMKGDECVVANSQQYTNQDLAYLAAQN